MILIDKALKERHARGAPVRVGLIGAGFAGKSIALQLVAYSPGIELCAISNRTLPAAMEAYRKAGAPDPVEVATTEQLGAALRQRRKAVTSDPAVLCRSPDLEVIIEATGTVEFGAGVALSALESRKHLLLMNAELDGTLGPILKVYADKAGVVYTNVDGDQPGVTMNLFRFVGGTGLKPILCGNIKGLQDPYRTPATQADYARQWNQRPCMVTSFADGTKISFEQAVVANATGMTVSRRGMLGPTVPEGTSVSGAADWYGVDELMSGPGVVDYVVGAAPSPGVFVLAACDDPRQRPYLKQYKLGEGPVYCFHTPYHLCHFEVPNTVARAAIFNDATICPLGPPAVEVVATAKTNLSAGAVIDGIGEYMTYGQCEKVSVSREEGLLPMGLAWGCRLRNDVEKDRVLRIEDVEMPAERIHDRLKKEQDGHFFRE
jgi:predicted homoserine dehydrogenase-like protein